MRLRSGVAIDLGTVNTLVSISGRGLIIDEPSAIALDRSTGRVAAVGEAADALAGKEPQGVEVVHPLRDGVIADLEAATAMLQGFLRRATAAPRPAPHRRRWSACRAAPPGWNAARWRPRLGAVRPRCTVQLVDEPVAAAAGAGFDLAAGIRRLHRGRGRRHHRGGGGGRRPDRPRPVAADGRQRDGRRDRRHGQDRTGPDARPERGPQPEDARSAWPTTARVDGGRRGGRGAAARPGSSTCRAGWSPGPWSTS